MESFISASTVPMPAILNFSTNTLATLGDRKPGSVGSRWMFLQSGKGNCDPYYDPAIVLPNSAADCCAAASGFHWFL